MTSLIDQLRARASRVRGTRGYLDQESRTDVPDLAGALKEEQYLLQDVRVIMDNGVGVVIPPLYHEVLTAKLRVPAERRALQSAQRQLERVLQRLDREFRPNPAGLGVTVAWGLPYFGTHVPGPSFHYLPVDNRASIGTGESVLAVSDAIKFPSDPDDVILEDNDVAVLLRSDSPDHIAAAATKLFKEDLDFWELTSIRKGFIGGGFEGEPGLPKQKALEAGIPGAELIPDGAQLFMGFTSSQKAALGGDMIANFESIPSLTDQWPTGYFRQGTTMHLSHLYEDLEAWYTKFNFAERVARGFRPTLHDVKPGTQTISQSASRVGRDVDNADDLQKYGVIGHSAALQPATRLPMDLVDNYGNFYPEGTPVPNRADFNTLDNPFFWSATPARDRWSDKPAAGLHFIVFAPTSDGVHRGRLAMDGHYHDGTVLKIDPRSPHQGMNSVLRTTHRQNFLVPPRAHRSFPLVEFL